MKSELKIFMKEFRWDTSKDGNNINIKHRERSCADALSQVLW
jgi:hypothetical protein